MHMMCRKNNNNERRGTLHQEERRDGELQLHANFCSHCNAGQSFDRREEHEMLKVKANLSSKRMVFAFLGVTIKRTRALLVRGAEDTEATFPLQRPQACKSYRREASTLHHEGRDTEQGHECAPSSPRGNQGAHERVHRGSSIPVKTL